jgi:hypothetical protein
LGTALPTYGYVDGVIYLDFMMGGVRGFPTQLIVGEEFGRHCAYSAGANLIVLRNLLVKRRR